ncbi:MAG: hypothetical protein U5L09_14460 [Bacteroidales bacterium]|nr:hypothetical protein [Bacteroidales bacterium]
MDANEIVIRYHRDEKERMAGFDGDLKTYQLTKNLRTKSQNTKR